ncbi:M4 family metallopeptidase [uncultured Streptomyces sp.]|uniref:M4 family metallopeptidase n=1 Tax=uncultured Streptomyces sp. TaxID=174707 RepID=UPI00262CC423|nr:M4 family metallopeptidase [uncultured Streptomyces sp.]
MSPRTDGGLHPVFCTIVPPHLLDRLARSDDPVLAGPARRTLAADGLRRTRRRAATLEAPPVVPATAGAVPTKPHRTLYDCRNGTALPGREVRDEGEDATGDASVNRAYAGLGATFELLLQAYGRSSIDGKGMPLIGSVHYDEKYNNAFFDGEQMVFGDGDGEIFLDFTVAVDVIAHELAHGLTQHTANLVYEGQSGALNESVSDVFGSLVKQYSLGQSAEQADWLIGAGLLAPRVSGEALRSMKAPGTAYDDDVLGKDPQPASMDDYIETDDDNGGVHLNSGIPNRAFYLLATALGGNSWERAGQLWFDVLTGGELTATADFADFARLTVSAARDRFGEGDEREAVLKAWSEVGVPTS